ncbi:MAG: hypothetical protein PHS84_00680 [Paludibacter sp.]|nr:hypothetical protein [Paludibacter sp.]
MKNKEILFLSIFCMLLSACGIHYTDHAVILKAESLLTEHPDSAFKLLNTIDKPEHLSKSDYAAWCLHYTQARYKLYMDIKSDSLIQVAVDYYAKTDLKKYSGTSYYMLGCVSELLHNNEKAMLAYKNALLALENTGEYNISGLATINMGYIYIQDKNYYEAGLCFKKSLELFKLSGNKKYQISSYLEISIMLLQLEQPFDSVMYYSDRALKLAEEVNDTVLYYYITSQQGELLYKKNKREAVNKILVGFNHCPDLRSRNASYLAYLYTELNKADSATFYLRIAHEEKGVSETEVLKNLAEAAVYEKRKNFEQAYYSFQQAYLRQDSIFYIKQKSQLYQIDKQFDLSEKEKENAELKIANRNVIIGIGFLIILILIILLVFQRINIRNKRKLTELEIKQQKTAFELREKELENSKKQELLLLKLQQKIDITVRFNKLQQGSFEPKKQAVFMEELTNELILTKDEWQDYIDEANSLFNNRITDLKEKHKDLTPSDLIVIVIIGMGIDISDGCLLLNLSKETMYKRRKRIKKRLEIEEDLEEWIMQNIV